MVKWAQCKSFYEICVLEEYFLYFPRDGLSIGKARRSIENNNPVVLLINIWPEYHYVIAFGTKNRYNTYNFGLFKVRKVHTDSWVLVSDNGVTTRKYNNLLPYYMNTHAILGKDFVTYTLTQK